jgi:hypothetical protein
MADYLWPSGLAPRAVSYYLQPHTGGTASPFSRVTKTYELSAPLWVCRMSFFGGYNGKSGVQAFGAVLDALFARLRGRANRIGVYDFRRPTMRDANTSAAGNLAASAGSFSMTITGLDPGASLLAGDYIGGDGRPHILVADAVADGSGQATVFFEPALRAAVGANAAVFGNPVGWFRLQSEDTGANPVQVGEGVSYDLDLLEDPLNAPLIFIPNQTLMIGGYTVLVAGDTVEMA